MAEERRIRQDELERIIKYEALKIKNMCILHLAGRLYNQYKTREEYLEQTLKVKAYEQRPRLAKERREKRQQSRQYFYYLGKHLNKNGFEFTKK